MLDFLQGVPLFYIMLAIPLAAAAIATFLLRASEWRQRSSIQDRFPPHMPRADSGAIIAVGEVKTYSDHVIYMAGSFSPGSAAALPFSSHSGARTERRGIKPRPRN